MARPPHLAKITAADMQRGGAERRLRTAKNARSLVADTLRGVERGWDGVDPAVAKVLIYGAQVLAQLVTAGETEDRLRKLERAAEARTLPALPVAEPPMPPPKREYVAPDRGTRRADDGDEGP